MTINVFKRAIRYSTILDGGFMNNVCMCHHCAWIFRENSSCYDYQPLRMDKNRRERVELFEHKNYKPASYSKNMMNHVL